MRMKKRMFINNFPVERLAVPKIKNASAYLSVHKCRRGLFFLILLLFILFFFVYFHFGTLSVIHHVCLCVYVCVRVRVCEIIFYVRNIEKKREVNEN